MAGPHRRSAEPLVRDLKGCGTVRCHPALSCGNAWQLTGSNYRGQSRRFYRPLSFQTGHMPLTSAYALQGVVPGRLRPLVLGDGELTRATDRNVPGHGRRSRSGYADRLSGSPATGLRVPETVSHLCDPGVLMNQPAEPVSPHDAYGSPQQADAHVQRAGPASGAGRRRLKGLMLAVQTSFAGLRNCPQAMWIAVGGSAPYAAGVPWRPERTRP